MEAGQGGRAPGVLGRCGSGDRHTILEKPYTDENEVVCWHHDHSKGRSVKGVNLVSCLYHSNGADIPVSFEVVRKDEGFTDPKTGRPRRRSRVTKNEMLRSMLSGLRERQLHHRWVLTDIWYASVENMEFIKNQLNKDFIMAVKGNRLVALTEQDRSHGCFVSADSLSMDADGSLKVFIKELDFPVFLVRQVFTNKDDTQGVLHLVCSDLTLTAAQTIETYQKRWRIEVFHKSIKSNTALGKSPTRTVRTQCNHFFASIYAFVKLERLRLKTQLNHFALKVTVCLKALRAGFEELQHLKIEMNPRKTTQLQEVFT